MQQALTSPWLENLVNRYLALDPEALKNISALQGKVICVDVLGIDRRFYLFPAADKLGITERYAGVIDTTIKGSPTALFKLSRQADTAAMMLSGEIEILGDVRTGRELKKCLAKLDIDWEEQLSKVVGDVPANMTFIAINRVSTWTRQALHALSADVSEYLQEESRDVVTRVELEEFNAQVDRLRDDVERLAALIRSKNKKG